MPCRCVLGKAADWGNSKSASTFFVYILSLDGVKSSLGEKTYPLQDRNWPVTLEHARGALQRQLLSNAGAHRLPSKPAFPSEIDDHARSHNQHNEQDEWIGPEKLQFRHVLEIHAVNPCNEGAPLSSAVSDTAFRMSTEYPAAASPLASAVPRPSKPIHTSETASFAAVPLTA